MIVRGLLIGGGVLLALAIVIIVVVAIITVLHARSIRRCWREMEADHARIRQDIADGGRPNRGRFRL